MSNNELIVRTLDNSVFKIKAHKIKNGDKHE